MGHLGNRLRHCGYLNAVLEVAELRSEWANEEDELSLTEFSVVAAT